MYLRTIIPLFMVSAMLGPGAVRGLAAPTLDAPPMSDTGHFSLKWDAQGEQEPEQFEVQRASTASFQDAATIYEGTDEATTMSGLWDGTYYFRVRLGQEAWSEPVQVVVRHHSLGKAFFFLGLGALVFLATAGLIIGGHRAQARDRTSEGEV